MTQAWTVEAAGYVIWAAWRSDAEDWRYDLSGDHDLTAEAACALMEEAGLSQRAAQAALAKARNAPPAPTP